MFKKGILFFIILVQILALSGCPGEDKSAKEEETEQFPNTMEQAYEELDQIVTLLNGPIFGSRDMVEQLKTQQLQMLTEIAAGQNGKTDTEKQAGNGESAKKGQESESGSEKMEQGEKEGKKSEEQENSGSGEEQGSKEQGSEEKGNKEQESEQDKKPEEENAQKTGAKEAEKTFRQEESLFGISQWKEENWKMIKVLTDSLYFTWNGLQPELAKKGISANQIGYFNTALEDMSRFITEKNIEDAQIAAFRMAEALAAFASYYRTKVPAELKRIKSLTVGIHFFAGQGDWEKSQELANQLQQEFSKLKPLMQNEQSQSQSFQMLEFSLADLNNSVQKQDLNLLVLRTNLVTSNLREMENELSQGQKQ
ncbi:MAG: hypothetical protein GX494_00205 [Clostridiaceae bacterium]|nr:hypothetical protein [Clostridiaceae bacterium]